MQDDQPGDGEAAGSVTTEEKPTTGWRSALVPVSQPEEASDDAEDQNADLSADDLALLKSDDGDELATRDEASEEDVSGGSEVNIPEDPSGYDLPQVEGHQWTEADAPFIESFMARAHAANLSQDAVRQLATWYGESIAEQSEAVRERDVADKKTAVAALKQDLGESGLRPAVRLMAKLFKDNSVFPKGTFERLVGARFPDGGLIINDPGIAKFFIRAARQRYATTSSRIEEIKQIRKSDYPRYIKERLDAELLELTRKKRA